MKELNVIKTPYEEFCGNLHLKETDEPDFIYTCDLDDEYIGFMIAYKHNKECIYLQYAAFDEKFRGYYAPILFNRIVDKVLDEYKGIICRIENTNIKAIKVALNAGFFIIGTRFDGVLFVELLKVKEGESNNGKDD